MGILIAFAQSAPGDFIFAWVGLIAGLVLLVAGVFLLIKVLELAADIRRIEAHADPATTCRTSD